MVVSATVSSACKPAKTVQVNLPLEGSQLALAKVPGDIQVINQTSQNGSLKQAWSQVNDAERLTYFGMTSSTNFFG